MTVLEASKRRHSDTTATPLRETKLEGKDLSDLQGRLLAKPALTPPCHKGQAGVQAEGATQRAAPPGGPKPLAGALTPTPSAAPRRVAGEARAGAAGYLARPR